ncbi:MAG: hypothetical protein NUV46_03860 [Nanoarchaeota archaeon]|nr:hypothetical protein [Nanoarchaeota archaeon]
MIINKNYVENNLQNISLMVENFSHLKTNISNCKVVIKKLNFDVIASYSDQTLKFNPKYGGNEDYLNLIIGHELAHNAQEFNFPNIFDSFKLFGGYRFWDDEKQKIIYSSYAKLFEGDATLIDNFLRKKYFKKPRRNFLWVPIIPHKLDYSSDYLVWAEILNKKFNGNRKDINEFYNAPIEEITKIFEI